MSNSDLINELISKEFEQQYFEECKHIWQNYVPLIEKIRCEAQDNGNINWDKEFTHFCEFITQNLVNQPIFSENEKQKIYVIMNYIKEWGLYAQQYNKGKITDDDVIPEKLAYTKDNLYDIICDFIGKLQNKHPEPINYSLNMKSIKR